VDGWPVVGVLPKLLRQPVEQLRSFPAAGPVTRVRVGPRDVFFVNHPDLAHEVLAERGGDFVKAGLGKERMRPLGGDGIALADGEQWARARRMISPLFARGRLAALADKMANTIDDHLSNWDEVADRDIEVDLSLEMAGLTLSVLSATMFSQSLDPAERDQLGRDWKAVMTWIQARVFTPGLPEWLPMPFERRGRQALHRIETQLNRMIAERGDGSADGDLLDALVSASDDGYRFDDVELRDHAINLIFAGHETTAATVTWALVLLEQHPEWAEQVIDEVDRVLGDRAPAYEDTIRLEVTRAAWEEALRIAPPGTVSPRSALVDSVLGGFLIPRDSIVLINYVAVQSHPQFWESPDRYDPSRFLGPDAGPRRQRAHMPFGTGPRACVGALMGTMEGVFVLAMVLQRFRLTLAPGSSMKATMRGTIHFKDGPRVLVRRRLGTNLGATPAPAEVPV